MDKIKAYQSILKKTVEIRNKIGYSDEFDAQYRSLVLSIGNIDSKIMIIGRDLGKDEVEHKEPFIGISGQLLRETIETIFRVPFKDFFFVTNLVPYKPAFNKAFSVNIVSRFVPILRALIKVIEPDYILAIGKESYQWITSEDGVLPNEIRSILTEVRRVYYNNGYIEVNNVLQSNINSKIIPIAHPSFISRKGGKQSKEFKDLFAVPLIKLESIL